MSLTFGTIIADRNLQMVGLKSLMLGIFLSILFGFIFGLILGTTEMPWGYNDWPTDEMKGRCVSLKTIRYITIDYVL